MGKHSSICSLLLVCHEWGLRQTSTLRSARLVQNGHLLLLSELKTPEPMRTLRNMQNEFLHVHKHDMLGPPTPKSIPGVILANCMMLHPLSEPDALGYFSESSSDKLSHNPSMSGSIGMPSNVKSPGPAPLMQSA